jgi:putative membrane protein
LAGGKSAARVGQSPFSIGRIGTVTRILAFALALVSAVLPLAASAQNYGYGAHPHYGEWGWGHFFLGPLAMVAVVVLIVVLAVLAVRWLGGTGSAPPAAAPAGKTPLDILKERFARGEIDKAEFEERKQALES